jgi:hypothetical protein
MVMLLNLPQNRIDDWLVVPAETVTSRDRNNLHETLVELPAECVIIFFILTIPLWAIGLLVFGRLGLSLKKVQTEIASLAKS